MATRADSISISLKTEKCVRRQLPKAIGRDDLQGLTAKEAWNKLCVEGNIAHTGEFFEPEVQCR